MELSLKVESWPIRGTFSISRGAKTEAQVIVATIRDGREEGRGECLPYKRYGETVESVQEQIVSVRSAIEGGVDRGELQKLLPAGAARNALDCALGDLEAKRQGKTIWELVGITEPNSVSTCFTISLDTPEKMAKAAQASSYTFLKIKLGAEGDEERLAKIRAAVPKARLIVDANEGWNERNIEAMVRACEVARVELIEQPLPEDKDGVLQGLKTEVPLCADESAYTAADISKLVGRYAAVSIKLDKAGGLTEALKMAQAAKDAGLSIMISCNVSTSLSMAPATVLAQYADYVDLDGPLLLEKDREPSIKYDKGKILPTTPELWG